MRLRAIGVAATLAFLPGAVHAQACSPVNRGLVHLEAPPGGAVSSTPQVLVAGRPQVLTPTPPDGWSFSFTPSDTIPPIEIRDPDAEPVGEAFTDRDGADCVAVWRFRARWTVRIRAGERIPVRDGAAILLTDTISGPHGGSHIRLRIYPRGIAGSEPTEGDDYFEYAIDGNRLANVGAVDSLSSTRVGDLVCRQMRRECNGLLRRVIRVNPPPWVSFGRGPS